MTGIRAAIFLGLLIISSNSAVAQLVPGGGIFANFRRLHDVVGQVRDPNLLQCAAVVAQEDRNGERHVRIDMLSWNFADADDREPLEINDYLTLRRNADGSSRLVFNYRDAPARLRGRTHLSPQLQERFRRRYPLDVEQPGSHFDLGRLARSRGPLPLQSAGRSCTMPRTKVSLYCAIPARIDDLYNRIRALELQNGECARIMPRDSHVICKDRNIETAFNPSPSGLTGDTSDHSRRACPPAGSVRILSPAIQQECFSQGWAGLPNGVPRPDANPGLTYAPGDEASTYSGEGSRPGVFGHSCDPTGFFAESTISDMPQTQPAPRLLEEYESLIPSTSGDSSQDRAI